MEMAHLLSSDKFSRLMYTSKLSGDYAIATATSTGPVRVLTCGYGIAEKG